MNASTLPDTERRLIAGVSAECLMAATTRIASTVRLSGSADEERAFAHIADVCGASGFEIER